jgi:hypothetical protein
VPVDFAQYERRRHAITAVDYRDCPAVLIRLASVTECDLRELLESAWRRAAPKRVVAAFDSAHDS